MSHWRARASLRRSRQLLSDAGMPSLARAPLWVWPGSRASSSKRSVPSSSAPRNSRVHASTDLLIPRIYAGVGSTQHGPLRERRGYASTPPASPNGARIISSTREHSPGHHVATIAVSNPGKINIVNSALLEDLCRTCRELGTDERLRAVVLTGAPTPTGKAASFVGGADITEMIALTSPAQARAFIDRVHRACDALRALPVPVIARIHGFCLGAGLEIAAACDLRVATRASVFAMPEVRVGIPSVVEAAYLPGLIGMGRTRRLLYLAESLEAREAERWGLLEGLVADPAELDELMERWVDGLVGMGPKAIRAQKRLMQTWENSTVEEGIEAGAVAYAEAFADGGREPREFMGKFVGRDRKR